MGVQDRDWYWESRDSDGRPGRGGRRHVPRYGDRSNRPNPVATALAAAAAAALVWMIGVWFVQWRAERAIELLVRTQQNVLRQSQMQAEQMLRDNAVREEQRQAELQRQRAMRSQAIAEQSRLEEAARQVAMDAANRKARAWAEFYRKPSYCEDAATVECANGYIRAKRAFDEKFARGQL